MRACGGSDENEEAPRRGSASAVRMAPSAAQEGQMRGVYRGEKGDFFRPSGVNCSGLCAAVRGTHISSRLPPFYPTLDKKISYSQSIDLDEPDPMVPLA